MLRIMSLKTTKFVAKLCFAWGQEQTIKRIHWIPLCLLKSVCYIDIMNKLQEKPLALQGKMSLLDILRIMSLKATKFVAKIRFAWGQEQRIQRKHWTPLCFLKSVFYIDIRNTLQDKIASAVGKMSFLDISEILTYA